MQDAQNLLDQQLKQLGRVVLTNGGSVKASDAKLRAEIEYGKFDQRRKEERTEDADKQIASLVEEAKKLPKRPKR